MEVGLGQFLKRAPTGSLVIDQGKKGGTEEDSFVLSPWVISSGLLLEALRAELVGLRPEGGLR